jgi:hypothetical protein
MNCATGQYAIIKIIRAPLFSLLFKSGLEFFNVRTHTAKGRQTHLAALFAKLALTFHFMVNCVLFSQQHAPSAPEKYQQVSNCPKSNYINMLCRVLSHSLTQHSPFAI